VDMAKIKTAVAELDHDLLTIEAEGNYAGAKKLLDDLGVLRPAVRKALDSLQGIPTDIEPIFVTADELVPVEKPGPSTKSAGKKKTTNR
jgi:predicted deacylase